jgi:hypothetical protein
MNIKDATPPADFPSQVIMLDKDLAKRHPNKAFYLRVARPDGGVDHVDLDGAVTPIDARKIAVGNGYEPTHWMEVRDLWPTRLY